MLRGGAKWSVAVWRGSVAVWILLLEKRKRRLLVYKSDNLTYVVPMLKHQATAKVITKNT